VLVTDDMLPVEERHYDRKGRLARTMRFDEVKTMGGRRLPAHMMLEPTDVKGQRTEMRYLEVTFDVKLPVDTFDERRVLLRRRRSSLPDGAAARHERVPLRTAATR
jgi:Outer membrane lipoprotein-sorting protein